MGMTQSHEFNDVKLLLVNQITIPQTDTYDKEMMRFVRHEITEEEFDEVIKTWPWMNQHCVEFHRKLIQLAEREEKPATTGKPAKVETGKGGRGSSGGTSSSSATPKKQKANEELPEPSKRQKRDGTVAAPIQDIKKKNKKKVEIIDLTDD